MARFVDHPSALLRELAAARDGLTQHAYTQLAEDPVPAVRAELAKNPRIDEALVRRLAKDDGHDVQRSLVHHPGLPLDVLAQLARSTKLGSPLLPRIAAATTAEVADLATAADPTLRMLVALRRTCRTRSATGSPVTATRRSSRRSPRTRVCAKHNCSP